MSTAISHPLVYFSYKPKKDADRGAVVIDKHRNSIFCIHSYGYTKPHSGKVNSVNIGPIAAQVIKCTTNMPTSN